MIDGESCEFLPPNVITVLQTTIDQGVMAKPVNKEDQRGYDIQLPGT